ncbi:zf-HC2 domain-containing protein [Amycolatopsis lurida]
MPTTTSDELTDEKLLDAVRAGNLMAYGMLFQRYGQPARELAVRWLVAPTGVHDLTCLAFTRMLAALRRGAGPHDDLRLSLLLTMGHLTSKLRRGEKPSTPGPDEAIVRRWDNQLTDPAFRQLSPRLQLVLWHLELDPAPTDDLASLLGLSPSDVTDLIPHARDALRQAHLHTQDPQPRTADCAPSRQQLSAWVRGALSCHGNRGIEDHLAGCPNCLSAAIRLLGAHHELRHQEHADRTTGDRNGCAH